MFKRMRHVLRECCVRPSQACYFLAAASAAFVAGSSVRHRQVGCQASTHGPGRPTTDVALCPTSSCPDEKHPGKIAVLVRTCRPTDAKLLRILDWAEELVKTSGVDFFVSVDVSRCRDTVSRLRGLLSARGLQPQSVQIHEYTESELEATFPVLTELRCMVPGGPAAIPGKNQERSLAWGFHCECISLWRRSLGERADDYDFTWVLEDDVGYSGSLPELCLVYAGDSSDLISAGSIDIAKARFPIDTYGCNRRTSGWHFYFTATQEFDRRADYQKRYSPEFVQRFSRSLLQELDRWSTEGASAWSESMTPTVCAAGRFRCRSLDHKHIGDPWVWNGRVTEPRWQEILQAVRSGGESGKFYHALKF